MTEWLVRQPGSEPIGPVSTDLVIRGLQAGRVAPTAEVCRVGERRWAPISSVSEFVAEWFDGEETSVTDQPWFAQQSLTLPARSSPIPGRGGLGLAPPPRPRDPMPSRPRAPSAANGPQSSTLVAGQSRYDEIDDDAATRVAGSPMDDDAATRVAGSPLEPAPATGSYEVDDETMTRVARPPVRAPTANEPRPGGVLPTMPMSAAPSRGPVVSPRPAAGAPAAPAVPQRADEPPPPTQPYSGLGQAVQAPQGSFPTPLAGGGLASSAPLHHVQQPQGSVQPGYYPTPMQGPVDYPPQYPPPHPSEPQPGPDQGLKALVALIVFLAVALAIVIILLLIRK